MFQKRNIYFKLSASVLLVVFMMGCNLFIPDGSSTGNSAEGSFTYPGGSGTFEIGELYYDGPGGDTDQYHVWGMYLHSETLSFDSTTKAYSNSGDMMAFTMITDSGTDINTGSYTFDSTSPLVQTDSMVFGSANLLINYVADTGGNDENLSATSGTITVTSAGPDYVLSFEIETDAGTVTGEFESSLEIYTD